MNDGEEWKLFESDDWMNEHEKKLHEWMCGTVTEISTVIYFVPLKLKISKYTVLCIFVEESD